MTRVTGRGHLRLTDSIGAQDQLRGGALRRARSLGMAFWARTQAGQLVDGLVHQSDG